MSKLSEYLGQNLSGEVAVDDATREYFATDGSILKIRPQVVVFPRTTDDIRKTVRFAWRLAEKGMALPITARGYGSDTSGASIGRGAVVVFPAHMGKILELDTKIKKIRVQVGINARELQEVLATHGLMLPVFPSNPKFATIGGEIANNTAGAKALKYGAIGNYTDRLEVVLSNGEVIQTGRLGRGELSKKKGLSTLEGEIYRELDALIDENAAVIDKLRGDLPSGVGYNLADVKRKDGSFDLTPLLVGSQGTLAIASQAILRLEVKPTQTALMVAVLNSLDDLSDIVAAVNSANPSQFDFIDGEALKWIQKSTGVKPLNMLNIKDPAGVFVIELDDGDGGHSKNARKLSKMLEEIGAVVQLAETVDDKEDIWAIGNMLAVLRDQAAGERQVVSFGDAVVPIKNIEKFYLVAQKLIRARKFTGFISGRVGAGNITISALLDLKKVGDRQAAFNTARDFYSVTGKLGGEIAGDSGDGRLRQAAAAGQYDDQALGVFEKVKQIFDPKGILNPNVIIGADESELIAKLNTTPRQRFLDYRPRVW
jgi:FAD/FMN-containing dehydrogenase